VASEAGKGDKRRPTDEQKVQQNWDSIFKKKPDDCAEKIVEMTKLNKELYVFENKIQKSS
jgi:hypothetical protein